MKSVRIIVYKPENFNIGNLFADIISERGNILLVRLSKSVQGNVIKSDLMELTPQSQKDSFKGLKQNYSVMINGKLINESSNESENLISGSVTYD